MIWGAVFGDIIGSYYEVRCTKDYGFELHRESTFTDDTVMTAAVCKAIVLDSRPVSFFKLNVRALEYAAQYKQFYSHYPNAGYGQMFSDWANERGFSRRRSYGNGAAMRVVPIGFAYDTLEQAILQAKASCLYTHNSHEAVTGAEAVAAAVWLARHGISKDEIKEYIERNFRYDLSAPIAEIRGEYVFDSRVGYSVPPSIAAFLQSADYESAVRPAVSLGGAAATMSCIAGGIAEAFYGEIPRNIRDFFGIRLDGTINIFINEFNDKFK